MKTQLKNEPKDSSAGATRYAHLELAFSPNVNLVTVVRSFVSEFYERVLHNADLTSRLALATHELLENAVKFAADNSTRLFIEVEHDPRSVWVSIVTQNRAVANQVAALKALVEEIGAAPDPIAHYQVLMRRSAEREVGSGLGLGRIRAEALLSLALKVKGEVVELRAEGRHSIDAPVVAAVQGERA